MWLNDLLALNYTKVEQCGSGAAYCQIIDSIYGNVVMPKIKFDAKHEYEYLNNFKVLQDTFKRNKIDKPIPVDRLVRCKMQDNLEFLQWIKKFWDNNFPGNPYDAEGRRAGQVAAPPPLLGATTVGSARLTGSSTGRAPVRAAAGAGASTGATRRPIGGVSRTSAAAAVPNETIQALTAQMDEMKVSVDSLEKERDFYFAKLRDIEILVQERLGLLGEEAEQNPDPEAETLKQIQAVLYSTEEGFEVPEGAEPPLDEEETF
ncbi:probable EB1-like protein [Pseudozyma flocculosa]|nr:probable EB1-like protein [Pseudozyma flocculosa]